MSATINANHRRVLKWFIEGLDAKTIAGRTGYNVPTVTAVIEQVAGNDKTRASRLVREYELDLQRAGYAVEPVEAVEPAQPSSPPSAAPQMARGGVSALIDEAEATGDRYLVIRAQKVRTLMTEIRERMDMIRAETQARAEVARLEAELAAARARLKGGRTAPAPTTEPAPADESGPGPKELRAWAAERGIDCPDRGLVPRRIREAWDAEQAEVAA